MSDAATSPDETGNDVNPLERAIGGLTLRSIGPALMGGRIADIAIHPDRPSTWFVAVGSGGVWRTDNAGITWTPLFEEQHSYSIGCVRIDPSRPETVWVGTGEAVSGRHVAWGDGVYRSDDRGRTWRSVGLKGSEHISDILIDPRDGNTVYVAAEGPLWSSGGERGLYKTADGGETWERVLDVDDDTGVTSAVFAPNDPDTIVAATYQRRRRVWSFLGGGPGSGIQVSSDGGTTWTTSIGLPKSDMGRIGLAVTPADPSIVYATIEAGDPKERGFHASIDGGRSFERRNDYLSGGTGPHYYQELFASPTNAQRVYQVDVFLHVTDDGGRTFRNMETGKHKHSDNHVVWIDPTDGDHLIVGCDAGLYETHDHGDAWRHVSNLPISQFYRVAVDDSLPFANVLGGAQDLGTLYGPTRTTHLDGVRNQDWSVVLGADGYHAAFEPDDADTSYVSWQVGNMMRHDRRTMELTDVQPQPGPDDPPERWNWDAPLHLSPHDPARLYLGSHRVWRSDDRGDSWTPISDDLTSAANRYELAVGEHVASVDSGYDHMAMSDYATITAIAESPLVDGLLYVGSDDGHLHVSEDAGATWRAAGTPPDWPAVAFVNDLEACRFDADTVFLAADDHKSGDYSPRLYRSSDRGMTWESITGDLGDDTIVWCIEQDHVEPDLMFIGAERGVHVTVDGGVHWRRLSGGMPTIAVRDLAVQRRDGDLVAATFGRGFYVLDDYSPLRSLAAAATGDGAALMPVRDAWWYVPWQPMQAEGQPTLGTTAFRQPNPDFGAAFTYHLSDEIHSLKESRRSAERSNDGDVAFPGWDTLRDERLAGDSTVLLVVRDADGDAVRTLTASTGAGLHRTTWDLRRPAPDPVNLETPAFKAPWDTDPVGAMVSPGTYSVELVDVTDGSMTLLAGPESFEVRPTPAVADRIGDEAARDAAAVAAADLLRRVLGVAKRLDRVADRLRHLDAAVTAAPSALGLRVQVADLRRRHDALVTDVTGDPDRLRFEEPDTVSLRGAVSRVVSHHRSTTAVPTATQQRVLAESAPRCDAAEAAVAEIEADLDALTTAADATGASFTPR